MLAGTPLDANVGDNNVVITASDGNGGSVTDTFTIVVANTNDAPTVTSPIADASTDEDAAFSATASFADVDVGDVLTYSMSGAPTTLSIDSSTGAISGTPLNADVGVHTITVTATDDGTGTMSGSDEFVLTVVNTNDAPTISSTAIVTGTEDVAYSYTVTVDDVDPTVTTTVCDITNTGYSATCTFTLPAGETLDFAWSHDTYGDEFSMTVTLPDASVSS